MTAPPEPTAKVATAEAAAETPPGERGGTLWFWLPWPLLVVLDLWSKSAVFGFLQKVAVETGMQRLPEGQRRPYEVFDTDVLRLDLVSWGNTGTIWGLFQDGTIALMVVRCAAVVGLFWFVRNTLKTARLQQLVLSLVLAGAIGNLYDNFVRADRSVRDFLFFSGRWPWKWDFPAFNVADSCITVGAIGLFLLLWRDDGKAGRVPAA